MSSYTTLSYKLRRFEHIYKKIKSFAKNCGNLVEELVQVTAQQC